MTKNKTLSSQRMERVSDTYYIEKDVKKCFDRIKKKIWRSCDYRFATPIIMFINKEIGDNLK